jgi:hypothetical protein
MKLSVFGSSEIIYHHIRAAKKNSFSIFGIYSSNKNSKNVKKIAKKFNIKRIYYDWKSLIKDSSKNNCSVLIAGRIRDNKKILIDALKNNFKILIEKPIFTETKTFDKFLKYKKNIFTGYNRIFYTGIAALKKITNIKKTLNINVRCPEINKDNIILNTCHIISIIYYLYGKITLKKKIYNKDYIFCIFQTKNNINIFININYGSPDNFSIEFNFKNNRIVVSPIEELNVYNKLIKRKFKKNNIYIPAISKGINEYKLSNIKPGFDKQYSNFKKFVKNKKSLFMSIADSKEIISICNQIANK